jgi:hypothetical protein
MYTMKATDKNPTMDALLSSLMGKDRAEVIRLGKCMSCDRVGNIASSFRDDLSRKEYQISGMCQSCQDDIFGISEDDA